MLNQKKVLLKAFLNGGYLSGGIVNTEGEVCSGVLGIKRICDVTHLKSIPSYRNCEQKLNPIDIYQWRV